MGTVRQFIDDWRQRFSDAGIEDTRLNVELLVARVLGVNRGGVKARLDETLDLATEASIETLCDRRLSREPVDYILGEREFFGRKFHVQPGVLIPRPETEQIIELAKQQLAADTKGWAVDIGCGSGVLAVTLALEFPKLRVLATDLHPLPLLVTRRNAEALGVGDRVWCVRMDGISALRPSPLFELIVSNPPYVTPQDYPGLEPEVLNHEPREALVGGLGGMQIAQRLIGEIPARLKPGASCIMEHGMEQGAELRQAAEHAGLIEPRTVRDAFGRDRFLVAHR
jgi:release factor glutamine methyltransferase